MALDAETFLAPVGFIEPLTMFPEEDATTVTARIEAYIEDGYKRCAQLAASVKDLAVIEFVYWRAFLAVYISLSATPSSNSTSDQGSTVYTSAQIANFNALAEEHKVNFEGYLANAVPQSNLERFVSASVKHENTW